MLRWFWNNLSSFLLALVLALTVWVLAVSAEDPIQVRTVASSIPIELRNSPPNQILTNEVAQTARLTLRAPTSVWNELQPADISIWADLNGTGSGEHTIQLQAEVSERPVEIVSIEPASLRVIFEPSSTVAMAVDVVVIGEPALGYRADSAAAEPEEVTVYGPASVVERVAGVQVQIDLSGRSQSIGEDMNLTAVDESGDAVEGVELTPSQSHISIAVEDLGGYRSVVVSPTIEGGVEPGYQLTQITVSPTLVRVFSSDPQVISDLSGFVQTEPVSLAGATSGFERRVSLNLPDGVSIVGDQSVIVQVSITPIETSITINRQVEAQGLDSGLYAEASPQTVSLILNGPLPELDTLSPEDVRVVIDLLGLGQGTHQVTPEVIVALPSVEVRSILPDTIEVTITDQPPPTPTPPPSQ